MAVTLMSQTRDPYQAAFDIHREPSALRDRYGRHPLGQRALLARRLIEAGVPFVTLHDGGWDHHTTLFSTLRQRLPIFDATILAPPEVSRGEHMRYLVELRNRSLLPFRFTDCPAFVHNIAGPQGLGGGDAAGFRFIEHRQILNCAGVGAIAPGEQITFEMYFDIPTDVLAGTYVLPWRLDGPIYSTGYKVSFEIRT